jgi:putative ABC transport system permease protein
MRALDRKLLRDLRGLKGQVITIALVVAVGVACAVALASTHTTLARSQEAFYERNRLADVWISCKRAPRALLERVERIPGVLLAEAREVEWLVLDLPGLAEPAVAQVLSLPAGGAQLNAIYLRSGREPEPGRPGEVVIGEAFANARRLGPGDELTAVLNGRRAVLRVVGVALSPEFVFAVSPSGYDDDQRFGIFWMDEAQLAAGFRMEGAFNDLALRLSPGARVEPVLEELDRLLQPYGGQGARERARMPSHRMLTQELGQLRSQAIWTPAIFLLVASFLVNVVLSRLVGAQREQIAALKAVGYTNGEIGVHYLKLALVVLVLGAVSGVLLGGALGRGLTQVYLDYFRFPALEYRLDAVAALQGSLVSTVAALGSLFAVRAAVRLPPAEAMRPPSPPAYQPLLLDRVGLARLFSQRARMVLRDLQRQPLRLLLSSLGVAMAVAVLIVGRFSTDALDWLLDKHFGLEQRSGLEVSFRAAVPVEAVDALRAIPGVLKVEPVRMLGVRFRNGHLMQEGFLQAWPAGAQLRQVLDPGMLPVALPPDGVLLNEELLRRLGAQVGDELRLDALDGTGRSATVRVAGPSGQIFGLGGTLALSALDRLFGDQGVATGAALQVDAAQVDRICARLKDLSAVSGAARPDLARARFESRNTDFLQVLTVILTLFAGPSPWASSTTTPGSRWPCARATSPRCGCSAARGARCRRSSSASWPQGSCSPSRSASPPGAGSPS